MLELFSSKEKVSKISLKYLNCTRSEYVVRYVYPLDLKYFAGFQKYESKRFCFEYLFKIYIFKIHVDVKKLGEKHG